MLLVCFHLYRTELRNRPNSLKKNLVYFFKVNSTEAGSYFSESSGLERAVSRTMKVRRTVARDEG